MYKQPKNAAGAKNAKDFFTWAYANGDASAKALDYVPLPDALVKQVEAYWAQNMKF
jgi:phosphate transport system substrate-binding protein